MNYFHNAGKKYRFGPLGETGKGNRLLFEVWGQVVMLDIQSFSLIGLIGWVGWLLRELVLPSDRHTSLMFLTLNYEGLTCGKRKEGREEYTSLPE